MLEKSYSVGDLGKQIARLPSHLHCTLYVNVHEMQPSHNSVTVLGCALEKISSDILT